MTAAERATDRYPARPVGRDDQTGSPAIASAAPVGVGVGDAVVDSVDPVDGFPERCAPSLRILFLSSSESIWAGNYESELKFNLPSYQ